MTNKELITIREQDDFEEYEALGTLACTKCGATIKKGQSFYSNIDKDKFDYDFCKSCYELGSI